MFNKNLTRTLNTLCSITDSAVLRFPTTILTDSSKSIAVKVNISKIDDEKFEDFGLFNKLGKLVNLINLFGNPDISLTDNIINITEGKATTSFITDNIALLSSHEMSPEIFDKIRDANSVAEFDFNIDDIKRLKSAYHIYGDLDSITFSGNDNIVSVTLDALSTFNSNSNKFTISKECDVKKNFKLSIPFETLTKLPNLNYKMYIKYNENRDIYRFYLTCDDNDALEFLLSPSAK